MKIILKSGVITGALQAPASKSAMQRACAAALLRNGKSNIFNPGMSNDDKAAIGIIQKLGAKATVEQDHLHIESEGLKTIQQANVSEIDCGESGLSMRMFSPICALSEKEITIKGRGSLNKRPVDFFEKVLPSLGVTVISNNGLLPLKMKGPLQVQNVEVDGSASSQYITGLLMTYAVLAKLDTKIVINDLKSKPYVELTLSIMNHFGLAVPKNEDYNIFTFENVASENSATINYSVEGDWSNAAFWLVAGAINQSVTVKGLDINSTQADRAILQVLKNCGADMTIENESITISPRALSTFQFDATHCPDLFPPLVVLASFVNGISRIRGVNRLLHKESNRAQTLQTEFGKLGVGISFENDEMLIQGNTSIVGADCSSHNDHRIAMALAIASSRAKGTTSIANAEAINKSYPNFYNDLAKLGASFELID